MNHSSSSDKVRAVHTQCPPMVCMMACLYLWWAVVWPADTNAALLFMEANWSEIVLMVVAAHVVYDC